MRELILVSISALLGYIVFSAFSTSSTPEEAMHKILEQPHVNSEINKEIAFTKTDNTHQEKLIALENERKLNELKSSENIIIQNKKNETEIRMKELDNDLNHKIATLKIESQIEEKSQNSATYIIVALLVFLLLYILLRHRKRLYEIELEKQERYNEMLAKKEYAEKILEHISQGNLSFETERKLLSVLDELNGKTINPRKDDDLYHPNPDIIKLPSTRN